MRKILIAAGVVQRPRGAAQRSIPRAELVRLHFEERLTRTEIAERHGIALETLNGIMRGHGLEPRPYSRRLGGGRPLKYDPLLRLRVGQSVELRTPPHRQGSKAHLVRYYQAAKEQGIRVSVATIGAETVRVRRVPEGAPPPRYSRIPKEKMVRLYREGRLTNEQIAGRAGVSVSRVRALAREAGEPVNEITVRTRWPVIDKGRLEELHVRRRPTVNAVAKALAVSRGHVARSLRVHWIAERDDRGRPRHHGVRSLKVGESVDLPRWNQDATRRSRYASENYHAAARAAGMRISVRRMDEGTVRVTRKY